MSKRDTKQVHNDTYGEGTVTADEDGNFTRTTVGNNVVMDVTFAGESMPRAILVNYLRNTQAEKRAA